MKYINTFKTHSSYEEKLNGGGVDISLPNVSYCKDIKDVHYNPYNTVEFYVGEITSPQIVKIYTDLNTSVDIEVSKGNKWYSYLIPKDKGLYRLGERRSLCPIEKVNVKADIIIDGGDTIINCESVVEASFKGSNTSKLTIMNSIFASCINLTSLDLSGWDTSNVEDMDGMFGNCQNLASLDLSGWDTSKVTNISEMFSDCFGLKSLNLSGWDTSKVTSGMANVFGRCKSLESLDLSGWDTSNVEYMDTMFQGCSGLTSLDLSGWDTSKVTDMSQMFGGCTSLKTIKMVGCEKPTIDKIKAQLKADGLSENIVKQ